MTVIAVRNGVMASDSQYESACGYTKSRGQKIFRKDNALIGIAGTVEPAMIFVEWYGTPGPPPPELLSASADFSALVLTKSGMFEFDKWCRGIKVRERFHAIGHGATVALGALHSGMSAAVAARIACKVDPTCGLPIVTMSLK